MLKFVHLFNNSPFLSSFMSYQGFCSQFLSLIQFTFNRTCLFVSVTKYNPVYLNYMFEMPFQEISRLKKQTHIDLTTEEFLPFVMKSNKQKRRFWFPEPRQNTIIIWITINNSPNLHPLFQ